MSDYEGDWIPVDRSEIQQAPIARHDNLLGQIAPKGRSFAELRQNQSGRGNTISPEPVVGVPSDYRPLLQSSQPSTGHSKRSNHVQQSEPVVQGTLESHILQLQSHHRYLDNKVSPDCVFEMMHTYKDFSGALRPQDGLQQGQLAHNKLAHISVSTGAFIKIPEPQSNKFNIWGTEEQVNQAKLMLNAWELHVKEPGRLENTRKWVKTSAYDGRHQHRLMQDGLKQHHETMFQTFADDTMCPYEAYLIWPDGYDLDQYITDFDTDTLDQIRRQFMCRITHEKVKSRVTKIAAQTESDVFSVYDRLVCLSKEMVARQKRGMKLNQCRLPSTKAYRHCVSLDTNHYSGHIKDVLAKPQLIGGGLPRNEEDKWTQLRLQWEKKCHTATKAALRSCLSSLYVSEKHVRMRVTFGTLGLAKYKRPQDDEEFYTLDEFVAMVQDANVDMQQYPLSVGQTSQSFAQFTSFVDKIDALDQFGQPTYAWGIHFDFQTNQAANVLRLEMEFAPSYISFDEPEKHTTRWLNYKSNDTRDVEELLAVNIMDLERIGYQFHIGAVPLFTNDRVLQDLRSFEGNVQYKPSPGGLKVAPRRRAIYPLGKRDLRTVREITIARYPFKDTDGTFELRRIDVFPESSGQALPFPVRTEWHAAYYYQGWDTLLSQFASIKLGEDVNFNRSLSTFFPRNIDQDYPQLLPQGYKNFIKEVEEIQDLLTSATEHTRHAEGGEAA